MAFSFFRKRSAQSTPKLRQCQPGHRRCVIEALENRQLLAVVSHWTADDTALDAVGDNHGTLFNGAGYADGQIGRAFQFDGVNDGITVADDPSLALTQSLTIEGWVRADSLPTQSAHGLILFRGDDRGGLDPYQLRVERNGALAFLVNDSTANNQVKAPMPLGEFVHVAGTLDDATGEMGLYINGVLMSQVTTSIRPFGALDPASNPAIGIGNHGGYPNSPHNYPFDSLIDELRVHDTALSDAEVLDIYNAGRGSLQPSVSVLDSFATEGTEASVLVNDFVQPLSGGLANPRGITFGPNGDLFVALLGSTQILRYDGSSGGFLGVFADAAAGSDPSTWDLVFQDGDLFVTTSNNNSVLRFDAQTGAPAPAPGESGATFVTAGDGGLDGALGLAFGEDGYLYVVSKNTDNVLRYDGTTGAYLGAYVPSGSGGLDTPSSLLFGPDGNLYVVSPGDGVLRYQGPSGNSPGAFINLFVPEGSGGLQSIGPGGMAFSPSGDLYVSDRDADQVLRFDGATGDFVESLAVASPGILDAPRGLAFNEAGKLHVASAHFNAILRETATTDALVPVVLSSPSPTPVTVQVNAADGSAIADSDYVTTSETITFAPGETSHLVRVPITNDSAPEQTEDFSIVLSNASGAIIQGNPASVTVSDDDLIELFSDSFENGQWNGRWVEDSQNDWFTSTQRAVDGNYSAEVDGKATDATLTMANPVDLTPYGSITVSFSWYIESGFDGGEYLKFEVLSGSGWMEKAALRGNVNQENVWHRESIEIDGAELASDFKVRFVAKANRSNEDANVDNVRLIATSLAVPPSQAPSITTSPVTAATEDSPYAYDVDATDPDVGDTLTFSLDASPSGMTIEANTGVIQWTPSNADVGTSSVTVRVEDQTGAFATQSFDIAVTNVNDPPTITSSPVTSGTEGDAYAYDVDADDPDVDDTATFSLDQAPSGMTIDANAGVISWTPQSADVGAANDVTVRVTDADGAFDTQSFSVNVSAPSANVIFVADIWFESKRRDRDWRAVFEIHDQDSNPIAGVQIEVTFAGNTYTGTTDANGIFKTSWIRNLRGGNHYANVVDLALTDYVWNPLDLDLEDDSDGDGKPDDVLSN